MFEDENIFATGVVTKRRYHLTTAKGGRQYLTNREAEIVLLLVQGRRTKQIAWDLNASLHTVNTHLSNIKAKLHCTNIFQLGLVLGAWKLELNKL